MALNQVIISDLNPIRMVPVGDPAVINSRNDWHYNQIYPWEEKINYSQKWVQGATVYMQIESNFAPINGVIIDCHNVQIGTANVQVVPTTYINPQFVTYQIEFVPPVTDKVWYLVLSIGFEDTLTIFVSEPQQTVSPQKDILKIEYWHETNTRDIYFANGLKFSLYAEAILGQMTPKVERSIWIDQPFNAKTIEGINYQEFQFILGNAYGIAEYMADKLAGIFCMNHVLLNDVEYTQVEGSEWEVTSADAYPLHGYKTAIRPTKNVGGLRSENDNVPAQNFMVAYNISTKAFGAFNGNVSGQNLQIVKVE